MELDIFQIDAFAENVFQGNPAAVCPLTNWLEDDILQAIAMENNLSETAFFVESDDSFHIRWFTPTDEVNLCGHATLASAFVIFNYLRKDLDHINFISKSGDLYVKKSVDLLQLNFPTAKFKKIEPETAILECFQFEPEECYLSDEYLLVFSSENMIREMKPNFDKMKILDQYGVIITAAGEVADFVSRFFAPGIGIDEDPVTGSAHCILTPYWSKRLNKKQLVAYQVSKRGGVLYCTNANERTLISGKAVEFMRGTCRI